MPKIVSKRKRDETEKKADEQTDDQTIWPGFADDEPLAPDEPVEYEYYHEDWIIQ